MKTPNRLMTGVLLFALGAIAPRAQVDDPPPSAAEEATFLDRLEGQWRMEGRARPSSDAPWYRTASTMSATRRIKDRALVRDIEAPVISMTAVDVLWFDPAEESYHYFYLASNRDAPIIMKGEATGENEVTVYHEDPDSRTVIELIDPKTMVARDFRFDDDGTEWMSREVMHHRED